MTYPASTSTYTSGQTGTTTRAPGHTVPRGGAEDGNLNAALLSVWQPLLRNAVDESQVIVVMGKFLDTWSPEQLARLPEGARPGRIADLEEINEVALTLARAHCRFHGTSDDERLLLRMLTFLTHAAARLAQIAAYGRPPASPARRHSWN